MDSDSWTDRLASASRRYQLDFLSRSGESVSFLRFDYCCLNLKGVRMRQR